MCWDKHRYTTFLLKNFRFISIKHAISAVIHFSLSLQTKKQTSLHRLTANHGTIGMTCNCHWCAAGYILSKMCKLIVIHSLVTCSLVYISPDFPLFVIIFLTFATLARHGSTNTSARCDSFRILLNDTLFMQCAPGWDTAATQTPVSPPQCCNCSHQKYGPGNTFKKCKSNQTPQY
jgi:hypothetical protein